jgi:hypothetical protein
LQVFSEESEILQNGFYPNQSNILLSVHLTATPKIRRNF